MDINIDITTITGLRSQQEQFTITNEDDIIDLCGNGYRIITSSPESIELGMNTNNDDEQYSDERLDMDEYYLSEYGSAKLNSDDGVIDMPYISREHLTELFKDTGALSDWYDSLNRTITGIRIAYRYIA